MVKYLWQAAVIFGFTLLGELLHLLVPIPLPAAIWGLVLLFLALSFKIIKPEAIKEASSFLMVVMSVLFVPPAVNILEFWPVLAPNLAAICVIVVVSTLLVFAVAGIVTRLLLKKEGEK